LGLSHPTISPSSGSWQKQYLGISAFVADGTIESFVILDGHESLGKTAFWKNSSALGHLLDQNSLPGRIRSVWILSFVQKTKSQ